MLSIQKMRETRYLQKDISTERHTDGTEREKVAEIRT